MPIVVLVTFKAKPEAFEGLKSGLAGILPDTRDFPGSLGVSACADPASHTILIHERWNTPEDQQKYMAWRNEGGGMDGLGESLVAPPEFQTLEHIFG